MKDFGKYLDRMENDGEYGGIVEIFAWSNMINRYIIVYRDDGEPNSFGPISTTPTNGEPLRLWYSNGNHYEPIGNENLTQAIIISLLYVIISFFMHPFS